MLYLSANLHPTDLEAPFRPLFDEVRCDDPVVSERDVLRSLLPVLVVRVVLLELDAVSVLEVVLDVGPDRIRRGLVPALEASKRVRTRAGERSLALRGLCTRTRLVVTKDSAADDARSDNDCRYRGLEFHLTFLPVVTSATRMR